MMANEGKAKVIAILNDAKFDSVCKNVIKLLDIYIDEARLSNDTEESDQQIFRNQGTIRACGIMKDNILKGLPSGKNSLTE